MDKLKSLRILKLSQNASLKEIRSRYLQLSMTNHPDRGGNKEKFMEIKRAYETLSTTHSLNPTLHQSSNETSFDPHNLNNPPKPTKESYKFKSQLIGFTLGVAILFMINHQFQSQSKRTTRIQQQIGSQIASKRLN